MSFGVVVNIIITSVITRFIHIYIHMGKYLIKIHYQKSLAAVIVNRFKLLFSLCFRKLYGVI